MERETEKQNYLQVLQASETRYRRLFETAQDGILILNAETGEIDDVNPYMIDMLHYSHEEFVGMKLWEVSPFKDTVLNQNAFEELQDKGYIRYKDLPLETKEGKPIAVEFVSNVYKANGNMVIQCNIRNITERKEVDRKLQEALIFQQRLIDALPVPVFYKDPEGSYLGCNSSFEKFFGQKRERITGKSVHELSPKEFADIYDEKDRALLQNPGIQVYESTVKDTGGVVHSVIFHKATFPNTDGSVGGLIGGILDITDLKQMEEALVFNNVILRTQQEASIDGILVVDEKGKILSFNQRFVNLWGIPPDVIESKSDERTLQSVMDKLASPEEFIRKVKHLYETRDEISRDEIFLKDGRSFDRYSAPMFGTNRKYYGRVWYFRDITEQKQYEEALKLSEEKYRNIFENSVEGIFQKTIEGRFIIVNPVLAHIYGYSSPEEMIETITDIGGQLDVNPDDRNEFHRIIQEKGIITGFEVQQKRKDGSIFWASLNARSVYDERGKLLYYEGTSVDITDRKRAEEAIAREREKLRTLSDNAPFGMVLIDKEGHFTYINRKFTELFGYDLSEIPDGRTWFGKAYPDPKYRHMAISTWIGDLGDVKPGDRKPRVFTVACKDRTQRIVQIIASVLSTGVYLMTCEDITELRKLENQLRQSQKVEAIGTLAAGIAHDFNNVLTGIIGFTEMVYEDLISDSLEHKRLGLVLKGAHRGRDLVKQILTFSRQTEQDRKPLALNQTIEEGLKILRPLLPSTIQIMSRSLTDDDMTLADPVQIHQVLMNLCTNAAHAMRDNGGILDISISKTSLLEGDPRPVTEMEPGEYIVLEVRDTGCGMTSETLECMFDPFFTTKKQGEGTGLGLSVVRGILKSHGGHVAVESEPGKGTVFHIYFPKAEGYTVTEDKVVQAATGKNERILIIDDEDIIVELDKQRLSRLGYEVVATTSSVDALNIFRKEPDTFDLVITDQTMPHLTGMDLAAELLKIRATIPIILCTGHSDTVSPDSVKEVGIREFLMKPLAKQELAQAIRRVLDANAEG